MNCGDFVRDILGQAGIESSRKLYPNDFYNTFRREHNLAVEMPLHNLEEK